MVVPKGKRVPEGGTQLTEVLLPVVEVAVTSNVTTAPDALGAEATMSAGQLIVTVACVMSVWANVIAQSRNN